MDNYSEVFQRACLIQLSTSHWQGSKMLENSIMERINRNSDWLKGRKYLINPDLLGPIRTVLYRARNMIQKYSLPFPISSLYLIPKESLSDVDVRLRSYKTRFWEQVDEFIESYEPARTEAQTNLGELFNEADYPNDIRLKFAFDWRFLQLSVPSRTKILPPELYEREKDKFISLMNETKELAMTALREEFSQIVSHLVSRLTGNGGRPKMLNPTMFDRLHEFINDLSTRNLFEDDRLVEMCEQARSALGGVTTYGLRYNEGLREKIRGDMSVLKDEIDNALEDLPRRKIRLAA